MLGEYTGERVGRIGINNEFYGFKKEHHFKVASMNRH